MENLLEKTNLKQLEKEIGIRFKKKHFPLSALTHPSYRNEVKIPRKLHCFERMEFFGDSILNYVITKKLYKLYKTATEGVLSALRSTLVSKKVLFKVAQDIKFRKYLILGRGEKYHPDKEKRKIVADAFEAFIAAIYLDQGLEKCEKFILKQFKPFFCKKRLGILGHSAKTRLQEMSQKLYKKLPTYSTVQKRGKFVCTVTLFNAGKVKGEARSKRDAEKKAARQMLQKLRKKKRK